eukprot:190468-Chlamydomonas_euryale.AAC.2
MWEGEVAEPVREPGWSKGAVVLVGMAVRAFSATVNFSAPEWERDVSDRPTPFQQARTGLLRCSAGMSRSHEPRQQLPIQFATHGSDARCRSCPCSTQHMDRMHGLNFRRSPAAMQEGKPIRAAAPRMYACT